MSQATHLLLLHGDETAWAARTDDERAANEAAHGRFRVLAAGRGHTIVGGEELQSASTGRVVRRRAGTTPGVTDGPFGEITEVVGGFYLVATEDPEDLLALVIETLSEDVELRATVPHP